MKSSLGILSSKKHERLRKATQSENRGFESRFVAKWFQSKCSARQRIFLRSKKSWRKKNLSTQVSISIHRFRRFNPKKSDGNTYARNKYNWVQSTPERHHSYFAVARISCRVYAALLEKLVLMWR